MSRPEYLDDKVEVAEEGEDMAVPGERTLFQEDIGIYNAALNTPGSLGSATLNQALADIGTSRRTLWLTAGYWHLTQDHVIPANIRLWVPHGTSVSIAN